jgi:methylase of polypeptide subunit release factors
MAENISPESVAMPFRIDQEGDLAPLQQALERAGYTQPALAETIVRRDGSGRLDTNVLLRRTTALTPYNTLVRLFYLGQAVPLDLARDVLAPMALEPLLAIGLLQMADSGIRSTAVLIPYTEALIAHDFPAELIGGSEAASYVIGVGRASITLANLTVRQQVETALDLGTGSGFQALLAARHAVRVTATDLNPRALSFAGLNARLNGLSNIELRHGSLFEPVGELQFDLIVANPPFVVSPESRYLYRDSGLPGDALSEQVIHGAAAHLHEGGYSVVLCNWCHRTDDDWSERPRSWVSSNRCDAWLLCFKTEDPLTYASNWLSASESQDQEQYGQLLDRWLQYYAQMGIERISYGAVILRRRSSHANWLRADTVPSGQGVGSCSAQVQRIFAAQDFLADLQDARHLLDHALILAPDHQLEHMLTAEDGGWTVTEAFLKQKEGLQFTARIDRLVSTVLAGCDGRHALRELVADVAHGLGVAMDAVTPPCLQVVRQLMESGFLSVANGHTETDRASP